MLGSFHEEMRYPPQRNGIEYLLGRNPISVVIARQLLMVASFSVVFKASIDAVHGVRSSREITNGR